MKTLRNLQNGKNKISETSQALRKQYLLNYYSNKLSFVIKI